VAEDFRPKYNFKGMDVLLYVIVTYDKENKEI